MSDDNTTDDATNDTDDSERTDTRLIALRELFSHSDHEVERDGVIGDYQVAILDGCLHSSRIDALGPLGFTLGSVHAHITEVGGEQVTRIHATVNDTRE